MKLSITDVAKRIGLVTFLMTIVFFVNAQTQPSPAWHTSKDVQRYANKSLFEDQNLKKTHIEAKSTSPSWYISKGVYAKPSEPAKGNIKSEGTPAWTISKGVQRVGRE